MVDSARLGAVVDKGTAVASELVVESDRGGEATETLQDPFAQALEGSGAVAFEGQDVFTGPEDRFDPLTDRRQVRSVAGFVSASRTQDRRVTRGDLGGERASGVALVADQRDRASAINAVQQHQADLALIALGGAELQRSGGAIGAEDRVQPHPPEVPRMAGAPAVVSRVSDRAVQPGGPGSLDRLAAAGALHGGRVDQQQVVGIAWRLASENAHQPLQALGQPPP